MVKRLFDITLSLGLLLVLWPVLLLLAYFVRRDSPGPILYRGKRGGWRGRPFYILKFRTMVDNAEKIGGGTTRLGDPRVTRSGVWMRRYKLDELPQIFNVLKGEMSLVGPRPELLQYTEAYTQSERRILDVRPGVTDLASLEFHSLDKWVGSGDADRVYEEKILKKKNALRLEYALNRSFLLDLKILWRTSLLFLKKGLRSA